MRDRISSNKLQWQSFTPPRPLNKSLPFASNFVVVLVSQRTTARKNSSEIARSDPSTKAQAISSCKQLQNSSRKNTKNRNFTRGKKILFLVFLRDEFRQTSCNGKALRLPDR
eukprot:Lithocolla_globosa_v1_NODE_4446_length_1432_cov_14.986202.p3 type:complete len:112 gc:universal NODE_4446_length_1432_cov_14.986202:1096-1431(+)